MTDYGYYAKEHMPRIVGTSLALLSLAVLIVFWWKHTTTDVILYILLFIVGLLYSFSERFAHNYSYLYVLLAFISVLEFYVFYQLVLFIAEIISYYVSEYSAYDRPISAPSYSANKLSDLTHCRLYLLEPGIPRTFAQNIVPASVAKHIESAIVPQQIFLMTAPWLGCVIDVVSLLIKLALISLLSVAMVSLVTSAQEKRGEHLPERIVITQESSSSRTYGGTQVSVDEH